MEDFPPLKEFCENLADLKIYSTSDFFTFKREEGLPDGIPDKPLRAYPELQGKWSNLWDRVHALRRARGEEIEEKSKLSSGELKALVTKMVNTFDREEIPEEEFPIEAEDDTDLSEESEDISLSLTTGKPSDNRRRTRLNKQKPHNILQQGKDKQEKPRVYNDESHPTDTPLITSPQKVAEPVHYDPQEERKEAVLTLITENRYITKV